jgi:Fe-S-cluster-containing dehydrogenase component/formate-dependent nitrite reductase membrane component NrfD
MTRLGFAIDHRACIGCHACTVACKMENDVPLGVFRTWVKYVEKGSFPEARRYFSVLRCNHCENAPCVTICPTRALFYRDNGVVDFDGGACIGCKACMQACPYDALYIDPGSRTAAKCHFCQHRLEVGLEPACVIVCPTHAIVAGDLDDPASEIARLVAREPTQVRAPEQGTRPKVLYVGAEQAALDPTQPAQLDAYLWAERNLLDGELQPRLVEAEARARTVYDVDHPVPWGWKVSAYLWSKSVAAGVAALAAAALLLGRAPTPLTATLAPAVALAFTVLTGVLLVADLRRPGRFLYVFLRPNPRSWLARGAWVLAVFGVLLGLWLLGHAAGREVVVEALAWVVLPVAALAAAYTGWLFAQAEGRDLWQSPLGAWNLLARAALAGAATLALGERIVAHEALRRELAWTIVVAAGLWAGMTAIELWRTGQGTEPGRRAARNLVRGPYGALFRAGVALGMVVPAALAGTYLVSEEVAALALGAASAHAGLLLSEHAFVKAGQSVPLS